ncbi:nucleophile aminohydrolase [Kockiozyma suomiensis]|uniref:nucleophile aminohydrolase n=1 Tax=Kockiozyma suomiensis TaxID=1337062 RepID=UPI00334436DE
MDVILGITTEKEVIVITSRAAVRGVSILKTDDDKTRVVAPHTLLAYTGEAGDTVQFAEYIQANIQLHEMRNTTELSPPAITSFIRTQLATSLRSRKPYNVNVLVAGFDTATDKPELNWIDYLASRVKVPYAAHGYAAYYTLSLLDRWHRTDLTLAEGLEVADMCIAELKKRLPIDFKGVEIKVVDKDGVRTEKVTE